MTTIKLHIQLSALLCLLLCSGFVAAEEAVKNENKNNRYSNAANNAYLTDHADSSFKHAVKKQLYDADPFHKTRKRWHQQQPEAFKLHSQQRSALPKTDQSMSVDIQPRRNFYIERVQQRNELFNRIHEQHRQDVKERMEMMRQRIHPTRKYPAEVAGS